MRCSSACGCATSSDLRVTHRWLSRFAEPSDLCRILHWLEYRICSRPVQFGVVWTIVPGNAAWRNLEIWPGWWLADVPLGRSLIVPVDLSTWTCLILNERPGAWKSLVWSYLFRRSAVLRMPCAVTPTVSAYRDSLLDLNWFRPESRGISPSFDRFSG